MKKFLSFALSLIMTFSLTVPAFAAEPNEVYNDLDGTADSQVTFQVINSCEHAGEKHYEDNGDGTHKEICVDCGEPTGPSLPHIDSNNDGTCDDCGTGTGPCKHEDASYIDNGDGTHDKTCNTCHEVIIDNEQHYDTDSDKLCDACGVEMPVPASLLIATVPVKLPILMQLNGIITVPTNAVITNHVTDKAIAVKDIALTTTDSWAVKNISEDFYALPEGSNNMAVSFRGDSSNADGSFTLTSGNWNIGADSDLALNMAAKIPLRTTTSEETEIATAAFTLTWATAPNVSTSNNKTGIDDQKKINGSLSTRVVDITIDPGTGTIEPSDTVIKTNVHGRIEFFPTVTHPDGYELLYWKDANTGNIVDTNTVFTSATTIYPVFDIPADITVTFASVEHCQVTPTSATLTNGATTLDEAGITVSTVLDDGYRLSGWMDSEGNTIDNIQLFVFSGSTTVTPVLKDAVLGEWKNATLPSYANWLDIAYGDDKFVAVAKGSNMAVYSTDGITWISIRLPLSTGAACVTYGDKKFVAIGYDNDNKPYTYNSNRAAYSADGITWIETTLPLSERWSSIAYGNNKFVMVACDSDKAAYSTDGITWTISTLPSSEIWESVAYGNGKFVAIASYTNKYAYSNDGITWITATMPSNANWRGITHGNGKFIATTSEANQAAYSTDGITWTMSTLPSSGWWGHIAYGNSEFVTVAQNSNNAAYTTDGLTWTSSLLPSSTKWGPITYGNNRFVTISTNSNQAAYCIVA